MAEPSSLTVADRALTVKAYRGDGCVMIAMNLAESACDGLAGFAIARSTGGGNFSYTKNRLGFDPSTGAYAAKDPMQQLADAQPSNIAPYQKFRWVDYPPREGTASCIYRVEAMYFTPGAAAAGSQPALRVGYSVTFTIKLGGDAYTNFAIGFTRGYVSSQAFADRFVGVKTMRPPGLKGTAAVTYSTKSKIPAMRPPVVSWHDMYVWLGGHGREILANFTQRLKDDGSDFDVFAYDLDEPDFINFLAGCARAGRQVRMILDNSTLHTKKGAREILSAKVLLAAGVELRRGHFRRYAHDKCIIERDKDGNAVRVLTGSANFSIRGLYVQSNSVIAIDDPQVAGLYGKAFDEAWSDMPQFAGSPIASRWFAAEGSHIPPFSVSFAPHTSGSVALDRVAAAIRNAKSSVLFAVMELRGGGDVMSELTSLQRRPDIFSYGVTQTTQGVKFYKSSLPNGLLVPFSYLKAHVPAPFSTEWSGGEGQVIHHKFVVVDFNGPSPLVYCGSSNLAQGGEQRNGDNLLEIRDPAVAILYAVEAIQLVDHYEFRAVQSQATQSQPLVLQGPKRAAGPPWWKASYDSKNIKDRERKLFVS